MQSDDFRSIFLPYCLKKQDNGTYIVLNRNYKPLGFYTREHVEYSDFPISVKIKGINPKTASKLSANCGTNTDTIYLYNDGTVPTHRKNHMETYLTKIASLAKYKIRY